MKVQPNGREHESNATRRYFRRIRRTTLQVGLCLLLVFFVFPLIANVAVAAEKPASSESQQLLELNQLAEKNIYSNPVKALEVASEAFNKSIALQDRKGQSQALLSLGLAHLQLGNLPEVRRNLELSLAAAQQAAYLPGQGNAYNFLGTYFWEEGMYDQAMKNYTKALEIRTGLGDRIGMSKSINNLGLVQRKIGNYDKSVELFQQSLDLKGTEDATGRTNTLINLATTYQDMKKYDLAVQTLEQATVVAINANYVQGRAFARRSMGDVQLERRHLPEALENFLQATQLYERAGYAKGLAFSVYGVARVYEEQGENNLARQHFQQALLLAEKIGQRKLAADICYHSAQVARRSGDLSAAFDYYEQSIRIEQEIFKEESKRRIALQQVSYDNEKQQQEIDFLTNQADRKALEARNQDNLLLLSLMSLLVLGTTALYLRQQLRIKHKKEQELLAVTQRLEEAKEKLNLLAKTDHLTSLANRRHFDLRYAEAFEDAVKREEPLAVIMVDIDLFKEYNDLYGHQQGDDCLALVAKILKTVNSAEDWILARYGGEEFVIVAPVGFEKGLDLAEKARKAIEDQNMEHKRSPFARVTCSFGVAATGALKEINPELLLKAADQALYQAKAAGRNCVRPQNTEFMEIT